MSERRNTNLFEVLVGQIGQDDKADVVLGKALRVLPETELLKPDRDLLHRGAPPDYRASSARIGEFIPNGYSVGVAPIGRPVPPVAGPTDERMGEFGNGPLAALPPGS